MGKDSNFLSALVLSFSAGLEENEDTPLSLRHGSIRLLAAFDGCGGVGGRRYPQLNNRTGAHIASGLYAQCLKEWFAKKTATLPVEKTAEELDALFLGAAKGYSEKFLKQAPSAVTGSMVRTLPSTAAIALVYPECAQLYWAGNTRIYLLTWQGLRQLTADDTAKPYDALESLFLDAPLTNYLCADQPFRLHAKTLSLPEKGVLILATDGAYHTLPTPMHFEALLLDALYKSTVKKQWKKQLKDRLLTHAADDITLVLQPFGFSDYAELDLYFDKRRRHVQQAYILPADRTGTGDRLTLKSLWEMYQKE